MTERLGTEMSPEIDQPVLRLAVDLAEALAFHIIDTGLHQLERDARAPILVTHREPLDLGEIAEEPHPQAARRLVADEAYEMRGDHVVAVELLLEWTILLGEIDRRTDGGHQHEIAWIAREADGDGAGTRLGDRNPSTVHLQSSLIG